MQPLSIPFAEALARYPEFIRTRAAEFGITTTTQLWILGEEADWADSRLELGHPQRLRPDDSIALTKANWWLCGNDDLAGLLGELGQRLGFEVRVGDTLTWERSAAWTRNHGDRAPEGVLVERSPRGRYPNMAMPLGVEVAPLQVFPAWTLTRQNGVRCLRQFP